MKVWIARDKDGKAFVYFKQKPTKESLFGFWSNEIADHRYFPEELLPEDINPKWEDAGAIKVEITITKAKAK